MRVEQGARGWGDGEGWGQERTLGTPAVSAPTVGPMRGEGREKGVGLRPEGPLALPVEKLQCPGPEPGHVWPRREDGWEDGWEGAGQGRGSQVSERRDWRRGARAGPLEPRMLALCCLSSSPSSVACRLCDLGQIT